MNVELRIEAKHHRRKIAVSIFGGGCVLLALAAIIGISDNPPGILFMIAGMLGVVLGAFIFFARSGGRSPGLHLLYWTPRALTIVFALFISVFALDVFDEGRGFWQTILALLMHLTPTFVLLILLAVSWRREWIAGVVFPLLGVLYCVWAWGRPFAVWSTLALMAGPPILVGILFLLNWHLRSRLRGSS